MKGVYFPARLHDRDGDTTQDDCGTLRGTVMSTHTESDGDIHIKVQLDAGYLRYLAPGNHYQTVPDRCRFQRLDTRNCVQNLMVLEIIPQHCQGHYPYNQNCADRGDFLDPGRTQRRRLHRSHRLLGARLRQTPPVGGLGIPPLDGHFD
jgi:hypothetical protein